MNKEKILNMLSFILGLLGIFIIIFFRNNLLIVGLLGGFISTLYGLCHILNKNTYGYIFCSLGLSLFIGLICYKNTILDKGETTTFIICSSIFILMFISILFMYFNKKEIKKAYSLTVESEVIDLIHNSNTNKDFYKVIYQYTISDKVYQVESPSFVSHFIPNIGDKCVIYVDRKDYTNVYFDKGKLEKIYDIGLSLFLMIASFIIILFLFL